MFVCRDGAESRAECRAGTGAAAAVAVAAVAVAAAAVVAAAAAAVAVAAAAAVATAVAVAAAAAVAAAVAMAGVGGLAGGSAGALDVLLGMVGELPANLPASILVAIHTRPAYESAFPQVLSHRGPLPASHPVHGIKQGHIYIAPPDNHLLVRQGIMHVVRGPLENGHRPAVDALFRTAAAAYDSRVIAVVLSGYLDCGTAGMLSIKARGGIGVAQDPESALASDMPRSVIEHAHVDHVVHPLELPGLLAKLTATPARASVEPDHLIRQIEGTKPGNPAELVCPICQGVLTETHSGQFEHFRCHVGHTFSLESLVREQSEELERALWAAVRALEESSALSERLSRTQGAELSARFAEKAHTLKEQAALIQRILLYGDTLTRQDNPEAPRISLRADHELSSDPMSDE